MRLRSLFPPWVALMLVAPAIGEVLSGSSPPRELLNPIALFFLVGLYGCGALLARELAFRWRKGWPTILALGAAYGIIEEGLMTKSFFDPGWMDVGILGSYGRWLGVNWVWTLELTVFHMVFSIGAAILLVNLAYPGRRNEAWVSRRAVALAGALLLAIVAFGYLFMTPYRPSMILYALAVLATTALIFIAYRLPAAVSIKNPGRLPGARRLLAAGFVWTLTLFLLVWVLPHTGLPAFADFLLLLALAVAGLWQLARLYSHGSSFDDAHKLALVIGILDFFILLWLVVGIGGAIDMGLASLIAAILLFLLWRSQRARRAQRPQIIQ